MNHSDVESSGAVEAMGLMAMLLLMDEASAGRPEMQLDLRSRRLIQALGLGGPQPVTAVGQRLGVTPSTMTGIADRVERLGYVQRTRHPTDRRASLLELTATGRSVYDEEVAFYRRLIDRALSPLDGIARRHMLAALRQLNAEQRYRYRPPGQVNVQ